MQMKATNEISIGHRSTMLIRIERIESFHLSSRALRTDIVNLILAHDQAGWIFTELYKRTIRRAMKGLSWAQGSAR